MEIFMEHYQITTDETLRETVQHGDSSYPFAYYPENIGNLIFTGLTGTGIMNWSSYMLQKALRPALQEPIR